MSHLLLYLDLKSMLCSSVTLSQKHQRPLQNSLSSIRDERITGSSILLVFIIIANSACAIMC